MEIADICSSLGKLADSGVLNQEANEACKQAARLLREVRELVFACASGDDLKGKLDELMAAQGEG
ncbi:hypothetical protein [Paraburkholderia sp. MM5482-R1]|uniref:hypothetical protein n=1 Tax=unclassified Paraburkholderia TaxID=2615204 RepID=UPI003D21551E